MSSSCRLRRQSQLYPQGGDRKKQQLVMFRRNATLAARSDNSIANITFRVPDRRDVRPEVFRLDSGFTVRKGSGRPVVANECLAAAAGIIYKQTGDTAINARLTASVQHRETPRISA
jgi:hypothetical protein